ncbi:hypothetical protein [Microbacterium sp. K24]|uniref:hypothetical protein n=1 Tax=Microbacterium sp. K24 TaxID=2305446 RepID=UPI00109C60DD|nr:hypothetical protein [Microbacterium sp. K24]
MSLLTRRAPHLVHVQNRTMTRDSRGLPVMNEVGKPIGVRCMVEPVRDWSSSEEVETLGLQVVDMAIVRAKEWPGDVNSHITWNGALFETVGAPQHHSVSRKTGHYRVTLKWLKDLG